MGLSSQILERLHLKVLKMFLVVMVVTFLPEMPKTTTLLEAMQPTP